MTLQKEQYEQVADCFPKQRKPAKISNLNVLNAVLYIVENGCKWGSLPKEYGDNLCPGKPLGEKGILEKAFLRLQQLGWGDPFVVRRELRRWSAGARPLAEAWPGGLSGLPFDGSRL